MSAETILHIIFIGAGATLCMDIQALLLRRLWGIASLDYALPGRWLLWMLKGKFLHRTIINTPALTGERLAGWIFHYVIGIFFAFVPVLLTGLHWLIAPDLSVALATGLLSLVAPFFIMQPALGFGVIAARTAAPKKARLMSLLAHLIYGFGLYLSAMITTVLIV